MKKVLIVSGHSNIQHDSVVNSLILKQVKQALPQVEIDLLCELYPDFKIDVAAEQAKALEADIIVFQFPLYWFNCPPLLKKWLDEVFEYNWAYGLNGDKLKNKKIGLAVTTGGKREYYKHGGKNKFSLDEILIPFEETINYAQGIYLPYFSVYGVSPHINELSDDELGKNAKEYVEYIRKTREEGDK